jgi:hypothetical protein
MYIMMQVKLGIGSKVYAVHKKYVDEKLSNGSVKICKVKTFKEYKGKVGPVFTEIGNSKMELIQETHYIYHELDLAIAAINVNKTL